MACLFLVPDYFVSVQDIFSMTCDVHQNSFIMYKLVELAIVFVLSFCSVIAMINATVTSVKYHVFFFFL